MYAEIIGLEKINKWFNQFTFQKIVLKKQSSIVYLKIIKGDETQSDLIEDFNNFVEDFIQLDNFKTYTLEIFGTYSQKENAKLSNVAKINIQFNQSNIANPFAKKEDKTETKKSDINTQDYIALAVENAELKSQLNRMEEKMDELLSEEYEEQNDTIGEPMTIGQALNQTFISKLDTIVDVVLASVMNRNNIIPQTAINGTDTDIMLIIEEFRIINPDIENDLLKLLNLAKTKPDMFKMLISTLRNM
jgi:hypothetical protein